MDTRELCIDELGTVNGGYFNTSSIKTPPKIYSNQGSGMLNAAMPDVDPYMRSAPVKAGRPVCGSDTGVDPYMRSVF